MTILNWPVYYCCPLQQVREIKLNDDFNTPRPNMYIVVQAVLRLQTATYTGRAKKK